jgi:mannose-6-phosphate isomerase
VVNLKQTPYFTTNLLSPTKPVQRDYAPLDSFVAYMCVEGECLVTALDCESEDKTVSMRIGEAVLIPASLNDILIEPKGHCKLLEVYVEI